MNAKLAAPARYRGEMGNLSFPLAEAMPCELIRRAAPRRVHEAASKARGRRTK